MRTLKKLVLASLMVFAVSCGKDENTDTGVSNNATHTYATAGTYKVAITGTFPSIDVGRPTQQNRDKL